MDHKKIVLLFATALTLAPLMARAPKAETFADLTNMIVDDVYMSTGILPKNTTREQIDAQRLMRKANNRAVINVFTHGLPVAKKRKRAEMIFPSELLSDANFFSPTKLNTVFAHIDKTLTHAGQVLFAATLAEGTTDLAVLKRRSDMIREFVAKDREDFRDDLFNTLVEFSKHESDLLTRWSSTEAEAINQTVAEASVKPTHPMLAKIGNFLKIASLHGIKWGSLCGIIAANTYIGWQFRNQYQNAAQGPAAVAPALRWQAASLAATIPFSLLGWNQVKNWADQKLHTSIEQRTLITKSVKGFNALVEAVNKIQGHLIEHVKRESLPTSFDAVAELKAEIAELTLKLNSSVESEDLLVAAQTLDNNIDRISTMLSFVGEMDAYFSMARHYLELFGKRGSGDERMVVEFCTFNTTSKVPYIRAEGYWNAIIDPIIAKTSSIELGGEMPGIGGEKPGRCAIVTGPNAGGKSVALRGLINQLILSHSYQMAWARKFETTPFKLVIGQLNNVDDLSAGDSRLMAEVKSMRSILERAKQLDAKKGEFAFVVTDELFTGTEVDVAIDISLEMGQEFADLKNVMYILATHFKELTTLEQITNGVFKNYHVEAYITKNDTGNEVTYPFKLFTGKGKINVALDIMLLQMKNREMENDSFYARLKALQARNEAAGQA